MPQQRDFLRRFPSIHQAQHNFLRCGQYDPDPKSGRAPALCQLHHLPSENLPPHSDAKWPSDPTAKFYELECATAVTGPWVHADTVTKAKATIKNLASGTLYYIRARACNAAGKGPWSEIVTRRAP